MKKILTLFILLSSSLSIFAQNNKGAMDDFGRIAIAPVIVEESNIPAHCRKVIESKLKQLVTKSGLAADSYDSRFIITAEADVLFQEVTATAPPMVALQVATTLYIGDAVTGQLFGSYSYDPAKGVGNNETRAYMEALKRVNINDPDVLAFVETSKTKIIEYYNSQIDLIIAEANSLASTDNYDEAIALLATVPTVCKDAHAKAMDVIADVFQTKIDAEGMALYNEAVATWKTGKNQDNAYAVVDILASIHPNSKSFSKSMTLVSEIEGYYSEIESRRRAIEERNWQFKMQQYSDSQAAAAEQRQLDHELNMKQAENNGILIQEVKGIVSSMAGSGRRGNLFSKVGSWFK